MAAAYLTLSCALSTAICIAYVSGYAEFDLFNGFDGYNDTNVAEAATAKMETLAIEKFLETTKLSSVATSNSSSTSSASVVTEKPRAIPCPEEEKPANIGPYEVPTQRDLVKQMKATLMTLFESYHANALSFLKDIKEASRATASIAQKCHSSDREVYKKCVKHVNKQCEVITKSLVTSLEYQRHDVFAITDDKVCNLSLMKTDPVVLIKVLSMELASLEFALPGFLRLLDACSVYCNRSRSNATKNISRRPTSMRYLTDQDLVVRHFLARKNVIRVPLVGRKK